MQATIGSSSSSAWTRMVKGVHQLTLEKYWSCKGIGQGRSLDSNPFTVGGHEWAIVVFPDGTSQDKTYGGDDYEEGHVYFGLHVRFLRSSSIESDGGVRFCFQMTLLDQSGQGNHWTSSGLDESPITVATGQCMGFPCFIDRDFLEKSSYLKDDCLKIECTICVVLLPPDHETTEFLHVSPTVQCGDDFELHCLALLESGEGSDVVFNVKGEEKFRAHKPVLSSRSSVFKSMFAGHHLISDDQQETVITDVEPRVFKALLHFIYSDTLPEDVIPLLDGYAFEQSAKLLAAADKYDMKRLKGICESHLWRSVSLNRFADVLSLAEMCNAAELKRLCFNFAADSYDVLVELESFTSLQKRNPLLSMNWMTISAALKKEFLDGNEREKELNLQRLISLLGSG